MITKIIKLKTVDSTHKFAINMVESHRAFECGIVAERQTSGIGRCGRKWISAEGNLYSSIIINLSSFEEIPPAMASGILKTKNEISEISLAAACAVHESITELIPNKNNVYLHWPNDVYYNDGKLSGILISVIDNWAVISIGINIYSVPNSKAIALKEISSVISITALQLFKIVLCKLDSWMNLLKVNDFSSIRDYWLRHMVGLNRGVTVRNGRESVSGVIKGLDEFGRLILENNKGVLYIASGDMFTNESGILVDHE